MVQHISWSQGFYLRLYYRFMNKLPSLIYNLGILPNIIDKLHLFLDKFPYLIQLFFVWLIVNIHLKQELSLKIYSLDKDIVCNKI